MFRIGPKSSVIVSAGLLFLVTVFNQIALGGQKQDDPPQVTAKADDPYALDLSTLMDTKVTTASKFAEKLSDAPSVMSVVSRDEIRRFGGITLAEILQRVSGLTITSAFFADRSMVAVRGDQTRPDEGHVLLLINGRPVREVMQGGVSSDILESFPVAIIDRIEIIKGPGSVLYGSNAYTGVINLIIRKAKGKEFELSGAGGANAAAATNAQVLVEKGGWNVVAAAQSHLLPTWNVSFLDKLIPTAPVTDQNATLRDEGTGAYLGANYKGFSFMSSYTGLESPSFVRGIVGDVRWKRGFTDLGYSFKAAPKWDMTLNFTYDRTILDAPDYPTIHRDSYEAVLEWTNFVTFSDRDRLTFGSAYNHIAGTETYFGVTPALIDAQGQTSAMSFYAQYEHKLTDDIKLIGGFQANKIGKIALNVVPRAGVVWNPADHFTLKTLYGGAFRAPSLDDTLLNHPGLKGNPNLVPEQVGTFDVQASYQDNKLQLSVGYFYSRQTHLIVEDGSTFPAHYLNLATPVYFKGMEFESKYYVHKSWYLLGSMLYQTSHDAAVKLVLNTVPSASAKAGVSYQSENGFNLSVFDAYQGRIPGYALALNPLPVAEHSVNAHLRFDLTKHWLKTDARGIAAFVHGDNLANQAVWLPALGSGVGNTIPVSQGRMILFGVEVWQKVE